MLVAAWPVVGACLFVMITFIGVRMFSYWKSFLFVSGRYRIREDVSTEDLRHLAIPFVKIQITTRGSPGSSEVIMRGIRNIMVAAEDDLIFYRSFLSIEVVTESSDQVRVLQDRFFGSSLPVHGLVVPVAYQTLHGTQMKARGLHYAVERRRDGWNARPGRTFIVHFDEESVLVPGELRKLFSHLATTEKKILEGPIYYPLEYLDAGPLCRSMEANRPVGCFECRHVMEKGLPLHLHGSNLVVDEAFENDIGWDIGCLDGQPLISEDYVFGMRAFARAGRGIFGWHGVVLLEQPPFSVRSAFRQRHRWIFGVLQGMAMSRRSSEFQALSWNVRQRLLWGTRYRVGTFALGAVVGAISIPLLPYLVIRSVLALHNGGALPLPWIANLWLAAVGAMWLGAALIGAWCNAVYAGMRLSHRVGEIARAILVAPVAGLIESTAAAWAVAEWVLGRRRAVWQPTPKTKEVDRAVARGPATRDLEHLNERACSESPLEEVLDLRETTPLCRVEHPLFDRAAATGQVQPSVRRDRPYLPDHDSRWGTAPRGEPTSAVGDIRAVGRREGPELVVLERAVAARPSGGGLAVVPEGVVNLNAIGVSSPIESEMPIAASIDTRRPTHASVGGLFTGAIVMVAGYSGLPLTLAIDRGLHSLPASTLVATSILGSGGVVILLILRRTSRTLSRRPSPNLDGAEIPSPKAA
ncbi:MAG: glycosyltransferase family 2 protein [Acidimicrobiales bacterium]